MPMASLPASAWDKEKAGVLLQRAGFGGEEVDALARMQPWQAADFLLGSPELAKADPPESITRPGLTEQQRYLRRRLTLLTPKDREEKASQLNRAVRAEQERRLTELRGWWLDRMANSATAAREKLVLFLHGHFATSEEKVRNPVLLYRQNQMFREKALGPWSELVLGIARDPAMLIYLDGAKSRPEHPNENFSRELFELFTLGEGNYTEKDIQESARAFTGWTIRMTKKPGEAMDEETTEPYFVNYPKWHDAKSKKIFGKSGGFDGEDVVRLALEQPAASRWITGKLWRFYTGSNPSPPMHRELVATWDENKGQIRPFLQAMWTHPEFYNPELARNRVKSPVEWLVGLCRQLGRALPAPALASEMTSQLGQKLFAPPNVKGWDGGITWINTASLEKRYEYGNWLVGGTVGMRRLGEMDLARLAIQSGLLEVPRPMIEGNAVDDPNVKKDFAEKRKAAARQARELLAISPAPLGPLAGPDERQDPDRLVAQLSARLLPGEPTPPELQARYRKATGEAIPLNDAAVRQTILAIVQSPVYQLG
ncbi:DUF1800 domain-containing protein [bacterium]|nr:DUF1800 domain-containing protein [bacterium]